MSSRQCAIDEIWRMLRWLETAGVMRWDLSVRRPDGTFIHRGTTNLDRRGMAHSLPWARWENAHGAEVHVRPARAGEKWPVLFLDDLAPRWAPLIARKYASLIVQTSREGGCHVWLKVTRPLDERERFVAQSYLASLIDADPASTSGEHWGRLSGTKNHKRGGQWVGIISATHGEPWNPQPALSPPKGGRVASPRPMHDGDISPHTDALTGRDESVAEFAWACHSLRHGIAAGAVQDQLADRAARRGKRKPERYAERTVQAALDRLIEPSPRDLTNPQRAATLTDRSSSDGR